MLRVKNTEMVIVWGSFATSTIAPSGQGKGVLYCILHLHPCQCIMETEWRCLRILCGRSHSASVFVWVRPQRRTFYELFAFFNETTEWLRTKTQNRDFDLPQRQTTRSSLSIETKQNYKAKQKSMGEYLILYSPSWPHIPLRTRWNWNWCQMFAIAFADLNWFMADI